MYLHKNREKMAQYVRAASELSGIGTDIVEKDYYVTLILYRLAKAMPSVVFKGGTSLSKCFHLIHRFSEDIDITFTEHLGEARRKRLKYDILGKLSEDIGLPVSNWERIESDKDYNYYLYNYEPIFSYPSQGIEPNVRLETALSSYAFPTEVREVSNILYDTLQDEISDELSEYDGLLPFDMQVQSLSRTFLDKIFALCDYYLQGKNRRYSRHLYDIYKLRDSVMPDEKLKALVPQVRAHRASLEICPSAQPNIDISALIAELCDKEFYRNDYETITSKLISDDVKYSDTVEVLKEVVKELF